MKDDLSPNWRQAYGELPFVAIALRAGCAQQPASQPYGSDLPPLTANGLPGAYELCARNAAVKAAAVYDVYYPCRDKIIQYLSQMGGKTQEEKAALGDEMDKRALDYAQQQAEAFHGVDAVRNASAPVEKPKPALSAPALLSPDDPAKKWAACAVQTILGAYQGGMDEPAILALAKARCNHLWDDAEPEVLDRTYGKILASVRAGTERGYTVTPSHPMAPGEIRM